MHNRNKTKKVGNDRDLFDYCSTTRSDSASTQKFASLFVVGGAMLAVGAGPINRSVLIDYYGADRNYPTQPTACPGAHSRPQNKLCSTDSVPLSGGPACAFLLLLATIEELARTTPAHHRRSVDSFTSTPGRSAGREDGDVKNEREDTKRTFLLMLSIRGQTTRSRLLRGRGNEDSRIVTAQSI